MCGFTAANRGRSVLVLERTNKVGKKILMSGGGRCRFTNLYTTHENFLSQNPHYCKSALSRYTPEDIIKLVESHRGLSGPAALQLSNYWQPGQSIEVDLMPDHDVCELTAKFKQENLKFLLRTFFNHYMPKKLVASLEWLWGQNLAEIPMANVPDKRLQEVVKRIKAWSIKPSGTEGYRTAEVTSGGVDTRDLESGSMESKTRPGLYFIGDLVDVTGELDGYHFQWAWTSGAVAENQFR